MPTEDAEASELIEPACEPLRGKIILISTKQDMYEQYEAIVKTLGARVINSLPSLHSCLLSQANIRLLTVAPLCFMSCEVGGQATWSTGDTRGVGWSAGYHSD